MAHPPLIPRCPSRHCKTDYRLSLQHLPRGTRTRKTMSSTHITSISEIHRLSSGVARPLVNFFSFPPLAFNRIVKSHGIPMDLEGSFSWLISLYLSFGFPAHSWRQISPPGRVTSISVSQATATGALAGAIRESPGWPVTWASATGQSSAGCTS